MELLQLCVAAPTEHSKGDNNFLVLGGKGLVVYHQVHSLVTTGIGHSYLHIYPWICEDKQQSSYSDTHVLDVSMVLVMLLP